MKMFKFFIGLTLLAATGMMAQGPLYDKVQVNLPYPITVNKTVLPPGEYVIQEHESAAGGSRILHFFTDQGMKLETTAMAIPALDNRTPQQTKLVLEHFGSDYYLNKIWVQGKDYGYEFPIPADVRMRERERNIPSTVVGQYQPAPPPVVAETKPAPGGSDASPSPSYARYGCELAEPGGWRNSADRFRIRVAPLSGLIDECGQANRLPLLPPCYVLSLTF
jgi:hypothetical protein